MSLVSLTFWHWAKGTDYVSTHIPGKLPVLIDAPSVFRPPRPTQHRGDETAACSNIYAQESEGCQRRLPIPQALRVSFLPSSRPALVYCPGGQMAVMMMAMTVTLSKEPEPVWSVHCTSTPYKMPHTASWSRRNWKEGGW